MTLVMLFSFEGTVVFQRL
jgi:cation-transporting ATPase 13A1